MYVTGMNQKMPKGKVKWFQFLSNGENKNDLMALFGEFLMSSDAVALANGIPLIFCGRKEVLEILPDSVEVQQSCNHEEADTKIPLFASKANSNVVAVAADCDILVLLVNTYAINKPSFQWQMKYETNKYANIRDICKTLGNVASSLVNFHIISGCDKTSYFFRQGKTNPFKKSLETGSLHLIASLGANTVISNQVLEDCKEFIRTVLYNGKVGESYLETRIRIYVDQPIASKSTLTIPPGEDSCTKHILQAHYQAYIWNHCECWMIPDIDSQKNGWKKSDGTLTPVWFDGPQFPPSVSNKSKRKAARDGYEGDDEDKDQKKTKGRKSHSRGQKFRKMVNNQVVELFEKGSDDDADQIIAVKPVEGENVSCDLVEMADAIEDFSCNDGNDEMENSNDSSFLIDENSAWERLSEFGDTSDSLDSDWM